MKKIFLSLIIFMLIMCGCGQNTKSTIAAKSALTPEAFLKTYDLKVQPNPQKFKVEVPKTWNFTPGEYPIGLFWELANEFSKDAGLDLTPLKGKTVEVLKYALIDELPGTDDKNKSKCPSSTVLLISNEKVVGAWLAFNHYEIGPSVKKHSLKDITGLDFEGWVEKKGLFSDLGKNKDIASLDPENLVKAYLDAIIAGDKTRANLCLTPTKMLDSLTCNLREPLLYNPNFSTKNSMVENIIKVKPISFQLIDFENLTNIQNIGTRTKVFVDTAMYIQWRDSKFNTDSGKDGRIFKLKKYSNGWRIENVNTGY